MADLVHMTPKPARPQQGRKKTTGRKNPIKAPNTASGKPQESKPLELVTSTNEIERKKQPVALKPGPQPRKAEVNEENKENVMPENDSSTVNTQAEPAEPKGGVAPVDKDKVEAFPPKTIQALVAEELRKTSSSSNYGPSTLFTESPWTDSTAAPTSKIENITVRVAQTKLPQAVETSHDEETSLDDPGYAHPPSRIYNFDRMIGRGAYGEVFRCATGQAPKKQYYAVKTMKPLEHKNKRGRSLDRRRKERQLKEIELLEFLRDHPERPQSIIEFFEAFEYGGAPFENERKSRLCLSFEFAKGPSLARILKKGPIKTVETIKSITKQTLGGLEFLHKNDIVHCDIKPENMKLMTDNSDNPIIKLIDFGLSLRITNGPVRSLGGTLMYQGPEVFLGKRVVTSKLDIWAFGVIFWEMFHGLDKFPIDPINMEGARKIRSDSREAHEYMRMYNKKEFDKELKFDTDEWQSNPEAIPLAKGLLEKDYQTRISAEDALKDAWLNS
ncbi:kinase-like protein [Fomitiporia mediterranea MF3/22]|uniref:kinase-like protein n=1 Tax=Fomitiporia mediterranea (strain MF3/22) TaxID=694068 RepID=UPI0004409C8B|nr:kinase-like protein [Fomitiporia mediterranea MF3/22]EJD04915.1 kinase-like protein [Fomitiporia mediterranea MF3/22]